MNVAASSQYDQTDNYMETGTESIKVETLFGCEIATTDRLIDNEITTTLYLSEHILKTTCY